jgi:hypothetical protein
MPQDANGRPDFARMRELQDDKNFQAQMQKIREAGQTQNEQMNANLTKQVLRVLTKKQQTTYAKLLGEKFDIALLNRGGPGFGMFGGRGPGGPGGPGGTGAPAGNNGNANASGATTSGNPTTTAPAPSNSTAPARKSLRERRGIGSGSPN